VAVLSEIVGTRGSSCAAQRSSASAVKRHIATPACYVPCARREDLRHLPVCSVDPPGCRDIDDALHIRSLPNGNAELGVHIADVTHFLRPGSAMDAEAASRWACMHVPDLDWPLSHACIAGSAMDAEAASRCACKCMRLFWTGQPYHVHAKLRYCCCMRHHVGWGHCPAPFVYSGEQDRMAAQGSQLDAEST
jgi:hypothetical protein